MRNKSVHLSFVLALLLGCSLTMMSASEQLVYANDYVGDHPSATVRPAPSGKRTVGKRPGARTNSISLPSKALSTYGGGAWGGTGVCNEDYIGNMEAEFFGVYPAEGVIELNKPHVAADLIVDPCHLYGQGVFPEDTRYQYTLTDPTGNILFDIVDWGVWFDFPDGAVEGSYILSIVGPWRSYSKVFYVQPYAGPRLELTDPVTGVNLKGGWVEVPHDHELNLHFYGFEPYSPLEIGLYQGMGSTTSPSYLLIDSWLVNANQVGEYEETLSFAPNTPADQYMLSACDQRKCSLTFDGVNPEPFGLPNSVIAPPIAWDDFALTPSDVPSTVPRAFNFTRCDGPCTVDSPPVLDAAPERSTKLFFQWEYVQFPAGATYTRTWRLLGLGEWVRYECRWSGSSSGFQTVVLSEPQGLRSGVWQVEVAIDGQEILTEQVEIEGNWQYWDPVGVLYRCQ
jgi:hypothetical protein